MAGETISRANTATTKPTGNLPGLAGFIQRYGVHGLALVILAALGWKYVETTEALRTSVDMMVKVMQTDAQERKLDREEQRRINDQVLRALERK